MFCMGNCSYETKRCLLLGRKAMTYPDSVLKNTNITLPTKVRIVMFFPVVMYGYESWTIKKAVHRRIDAFKLMVLEKTLESPLDSKKINQSILKAINPEYSLEGLMLKLKLQYFDYLM